MKRMIWGAIGLFLFCALIASQALAQSTGGSIRGTITDPKGLAVADAKISITNMGTNVTYVLSTSSAGVYNYPDLGVGLYAVTVEKDGFEKFTQSRIQIFANQVTEVSAVLTVGAVSTSVEVVGGTPLVQVGTSQISNDFNSLQITELPNTAANGSPLNLALLVPGSTGQGAGVLGEGGSIGGTRPRMNSFTIDGVDDNRLDVTGHSQDIIPDSIAEFNLVTNQFSADIGHSAGGEFNLITKTGSNDWHGDAWIYNQNRNYNARDNIDKAAGLEVPARYDNNRAGGDVGGPVIHDKLFVYGAYQAYWYGQAAQGVQQTTPTADGLATLNGVADPAVQSVLSKFPTAPTQAFDCGATNDQPCQETVTVAASTCSAGCIIPLGHIVPSAPNFLNEKDFIINGDYTQGKHQLAFHVLYNRERQPNVNFDTPLPQFTGDIAVDARKYLFKDTWILTSRLVNDFSVAYSRFSLAYSVPPAFADFPNVEVDTVGLDIGPQGCSPQSNIINTYQAKDDMSLVHGNHTFKWGGQYSRWIAPNDFLPRARGEWDYANFNELVNDYVPTGLNGALRGAGSGLFPGNQYGIALYVMDDWKITRRLTLNLGLRYEWDSVPAGDELQNLNSISAVSGPVEPRLFNAAGAPVGIPFGTPKSDTNNWAPRIGFAYDVLGDGKWAVRGGFGISYDITPQNFPSISLPPQLQTEQSPMLTCSLPNAPAWCANYPGNGQGFLAGGGLLSVNVPCADQATCRGSSSAYITNIVQPKVLTWSLGVQHDLGWNSSIEVRYLGTRGLDLPVQARLNTQSGFDAGLGALPTYLSDASVPGAVPDPGVTLNNWDNFENGPCPSDPGTPSPFRYGTLGFCDLLTGFPALANSIYHAVSADFNHRVGHGLTFRANYTFSKTIDDATNELFSSRVNPRRAQDWANLEEDRGLSALDVPHRLAVSWVYEIPGMSSDSRFVKTATSGWQWSGTWIAAKGTPVTILNGADANGDFDAAGDRPVLNPGATEAFNSTSNVDFVCNDGVGGATRIVPASAQNPNTGVIPCGTNNDANIVGYVAEDSGAKYVLAGLGARGTVRRDSFRSPGVNTWDMTIGKTTNLTERFKLQFRADFYDIFNHRSLTLTQPSVFEPSVNNALSSTYTTMTASAPFGGSQFLDPTQFSGGSRNIQFSLKLMF
jgi:Carboxypeptidase regulatory-like domain/TonB dependent receptor